MKYTPPVGGAPTDPFVDANPGIGQAGSAIPAGALEPHQHEIVNVITAAGLTPDAANNAQLLAAIQELIEIQAGNYVADTGAANAYVVALSPAITAYTNGLQVRFKIVHAPTGASTLNAGAGAVSLLDQDGNAWANGTAPAGAIVTATYDAASGHFYSTNIAPSGAGSVPVVSYAANHAVLASERGSLLVATATLTFTMLAPATAGAKFSVGYANFAAAPIILTTPSGTMLGAPAVGAASMALPPGGVIWFTTDGANWLVSQYSPGIDNGPVQGAFKNLIIVNGATPNNQGKVTVDEITVGDGNGNRLTLKAVNVTADLTVAGANGLDTGAVASSTWYALWVIYNSSTATTAALFSLSATAPTMPAGYTFKARVGWMRRNAAAKLLQTIQCGRDVQIIVDGTVLTGLPQIFSGIQGSISTPTWVAGSVTPFVPPNAVAIDVVATTGAGSNVVCMAAPNANYGAYGSSSNPAPLCAGEGTAGGNQTIPGRLILESSNIYNASSGSTCAIVVKGWQDNL